MKEGAGGGGGGGGGLEKTTFKKPNLNRVKQLPSNFNLGLALA